MDTDKKKKREKMHPTQLLNFILNKLESEKKANPRRKLTELQRARLAFSFYEFNFNPQENRYHQEVITKIK